MNARHLLTSGIALALLVPAAAVGTGSGTAHAHSAYAPASATKSLSGAAWAPSSGGPVTISLASSGNTVTLVVMASGRVYDFQLPARDITQTAKTVTLNTHGDLKGYGSVVVTWTKRTVTVPATPGSCGSKGTPAHKAVILEHPKGTASLKLPCLTLKGLRLGGPISGGIKPPSVLPGVGAYKGYIGSVVLQPATGTSLALTVHKGKTGNATIDGFVSKSYTSSTSAAPLTFQSQTLRLSVPASNLQVATDLGTAHLSLKSGPQPLKGTDLQWAALGTATPTSQGTGSCTTSGGSKPIGATRSSNVHGTVGLQTCITSGSYPVDATRTYGQLYSSALSVKAPTPLKMVRTTPADKATNVATTTETVTVTFSNPMQTTNAVATISGGTDFHYLKDPTLDSSKKTMTFTLDKALQPNTSYTMMVSAQDTFNQYGSSKTAFTTGQ